MEITDTVKKKQQLNSIHTNNDKPKSYPVQTYSHEVLNKYKMVTNIDSPPLIVWNRITCVGEKSSPIINISYALQMVRNGNFEF